MQVIVKTDCMCDELSSEHLVPITAAGEYRLSSRTPWTFTVVGGLDGSQSSVFDKFRAFFADLSNEGTTDTRRAKR